MFPAQPLPPGRAAIVFHSRRRRGHWRPGGRGAAGRRTGPFFDPLRRQAAGSESFRVGSLDALETGVPERVPIIGDRRDGWTDYRQEPVGAMFLVADAGRKDGAGLQRHLPACRLLGGVSAGAAVLFMPLPHQRLPARRQGD